MTESTGRYYVIELQPDSTCARYRLWERTDETPTAIVVGEFDSVESAKAAVPAVWRAGRSPNMVALGYLDTEATITQTSPARADRVRHDSGAHRTDAISTRD